MNANERSKKFTVHILSKPTLIFDKKEKNATTATESQKRYHMQQAFKTKKNGISCNLGMRLNG